MIGQPVEVHGKESHYNVTEENNEITEGNTINYFVPRFYYKEECHDKEDETDLFYDVVVKLFLVVSVCDVSETRLNYKIIV